MADAQPGDTMDPLTMTYRELQRALKDLGQRAVGNTEELRQRLLDYIENPDNLLREKKKDWVDWRNHAAREILRQDVERDGRLYGRDDVDATEAFDFYRENQPEFAGVPFDQFKARYDELIEIAARRRARSAKQEEYLRHDRRLHPRQSHNHRGEPVFDFDTNAKLLLRDDIKIYELHLEMSPAELWESRDVYMKYKLEIFRQRIYQEIRRNKFINYLEKKRTEKRRTFAATTATFQRN